MLIPLLKTKYQCPYRVPSEVVVEFHGLTEFFNRSINDPVVRIAKVVFFDFSEFIQIYQNIGDKDLADGIALTIADKLFSSEAFLGNPQTAMYEALYELGSSNELYFHDREFRALVHRTIKLLPKMNAFRFLDFKRFGNETTGK